MDRASAALRIARRFIAAGPGWPSYTNDLSLEGLLLLHARTGAPELIDFVTATWRHRGPHPRDTLTIGNSYFTSLHAEMYRLTGDDIYAEGIPELAANWWRSTPRSPDGIAGHRHAPHGALLLDMTAGYAPLMALSGRLGGDESFFDECVQHIAGCRQALRCPETGLWHHARGWTQGAPTALSPSGWCRGQGWALRAMVKSLEWLPVDCWQSHALRSVLEEFAIAVLRFQTDSGLWRQILWRPDSYEESSGSGLIAHALLRAVELGALPAAGFSQAATCAVTALSLKVNEAGAVADGSVETPPLSALDDYLSRRRELGDPHAQAAVLLALAQSL